VKAMASSVDAFAVLRLSEKAMPTTENSRSTVADALASPVAAPELRGRRHSHAAAGARRDSRSGTGLRRAVGA